MREALYRVGGGVRLLLVLAAGLGALASSANAAPTTAPDLGTASTYAVLSGASVGNTVSAVGAPHTTLHGDLGVVPATEPTGFPPGVVSGVTRVGGSVVAQAHADLVAAYNDIAGRPGGTALAGDLAGATLAPGLHSTAAAVSNTGTVTLDGGGDPGSIFVFKVGGALTMAAGAQMILTNGAQAANVFWQVNGAAGIGAAAKFAGTLMALNAIAVGAGTEVNGRALSLGGAISLDANEVYSAPPVVTINGGAAAITADSTPTVSGTTDVVAPAVVTVTIAGQTLTASPADGAWSVTSGLVANATYAVTASVVDGAGNAGSATQQLTVDTVLPVIAIDGGPTALTNDPTPTITGTGDGPPGTVVDVDVDAQSLTALVQANGSWNVTPAALVDGAHTVTASVRDPAGNAGTDTQTLTVDTIAPAVLITGGATALTNDATPEITGTAAVDPGATVTVDVADEILTGQVGSAGAWTVTAPALANGPHRVRLTAADAAGNVGSYTQTLTVDTVVPVVTITGGSARSTSELRPTIFGTSDAAPGTIITVTIAGQVLTTLVQPNGSWNAAPAAVGEGTWQVIASVPDPAGNAGTATQLLTITPLATSAGATGATGATGAAGPTGAAGSTGTGGPAGDAAVVPAVGLQLVAKKLVLVRGKALRVSFTLGAPAKLTLKVLRRGKTVATASATRSKAGRGSVTWNGKIKGKVAPRGQYTVEVRAVSTTGGSVRVAVPLRVT